MSDWFVWNFGSILLWSMIGGMTWLACQTRELKAKVKSPILAGLAASLVGAFELGLVALVSGAVYMLFLHVFRYWYVKLKGKEFDGLDLDLKQEELETPNVESKTEAKVESVVTPEVVKPTEKVKKVKINNKVG